MNDTRDYIIDEAFKLFLSRSYEAVSVNDISKAIGFTKGALYHHFTNKEDLFKAVIDKYFIIDGVSADFENITLQKYIQLTVSLVEKTINKIFNHSSNFDPINYMSLFVDSFRHYKGFAEEKKTFFIHEIQSIKTVLINCVKRGEIRSDIDTDLMADTYFSVTLGLATNLLQKKSIEITVNQLNKQLNHLYILLKV